MHAPKTIQRCDAIRQVLREFGSQTAEEIGHQLTLDRMLVNRLLRTMARDGFVGSDRAPGDRALHWHVFVEDGVHVDQQLVDAIESIPH